MKRALKVPLCCIAFLPIAGGAQLPSQSAQAPANRPPVPAGPYGIGRTAFDWTDTARIDPYSKDSQSHRELMVYIWYPARVSREMEPGEYFPFASEVEENPTAREAAHDEFGDRWPQIAAGTIRSHAVDGAPVIPGKRFPVILFSHGYSATTFSYTAQIEDFVSHGYVVVAIEHTGAAGLVRFVDGRVRLFQNSRTTSAPSTDPLQAMIASAEEGTQTGAEDDRFVLDRLHGRVGPLSSVNF